MAFASLAGALGKILRRHNIKDLEEIKIFSAWSGIVGEKMASHARPVRTSDRILYVEVDDPLWLAQLKYMKLDIIEKIDASIKEGLFKDIRFFLKNTA
jgi:predicted nucleic acid-binding Zn ribbon protein